MRLAEIELQKHKKKITRQQPLLPQNWMDLDAKARKKMTYFSWPILKGNRHHQNNLAQLVRKRFSTPSGKNRITHAAAPARNLCRSHATAICKVWVAKHKKIATRYSRTTSLDARNPIHKASRQLLTSIAQHREKITKITWKPEFQCQRASKIRRKSDDACTRRASAATFLRDGSVPLKN